MPAVERKKPMNCSKRELENFLHSTGWALPDCDRELMVYHHRLIESAEQILRKQSREFIEFHKTWLKKRFGQLKGLFNSRKEESEVSTVSDTDFGNLIDLDAMSEEIERPRVGKTTSFPSHNTQELSNNRPVDFPPPPPHMTQTVTFNDNLMTPSPVSAAEIPRHDQRMSTPYNQPPKRPRPENFHRSHILTPSTGNNQSRGAEKPFRSKFLVKFDEKKSSIESYLAAVDRWRLANNISDDQAMAIALDGFTNLELANHVSTGIMSNEDILTFDDFVAKLREYLGRSRTQFLDEFDSTKRKSQESPYVFLARLTDLLKLGLEVDTLTPEHNALIVRRFLKGLHPKLRGLLEARDEEPQIDTVAKLAWKLETALSIPAGAVVETVEKVNAVNARSPNLERKVSFSREQKCGICARNHATDRCFGNPASVNFDLQRFYAINSHLENSKNA